MKKQIQRILDRPTTAQEFKNLAVGVGLTFAIIGLLCVAFEKPVRYIRLPVSEWVCSRAKHVAKEITGPNQTRTTTECLEWRKKYE